MMLGDIFNERSILLNLHGTTKKAVFDELAGAITAAHPELDTKTLLAAVNEREEKMSTGIGSGAAIPHGACRKAGTAAGAIGVSRAGINYGSLDNKPVYVVFMTIMDEASPEDHLQVLNQIFELVHSEALARIRAAKNTQEVLDILSRLH